MNGKEPRENKNNEQEELQPKQKPELPLQIQQTSVSGVERLKPHEIAEKVIVELERDDFVKQQMKASAGVWEGYTIREHTLMVMTQFEKYFNKEQLPLGISIEVFRKILAVHDIGKPEAIIQGSKKKQHEYSKMYVPDILRKYGLSEKNIKIAEALVSGDPIGSYLKTGNMGDSIKEIKKLAEEAGVNVKDIFEILVVFYKVDAGAYTEDATIEGVVNGKPSLDSLFEFDRENHRMDFAENIREKIEELKRELVGSEPAKEKKSEKTEGKIESKKKK